MSEQTSATSVFEVELDAKNLIAANWLIQRKRFFWKRAVILFAGIWAFYVFGFTLNDFRLYGWQPQWIPQRMLESLTWGSGVFAILICLMLAIHPFIIRKSVKDAKRLAPVTSFAISDHGLQATNAISTSTVAWPMFQKWFENRKVLVLVLTRRESITFPKTVVEGETIARIRTHLIAANVPNR